MGGVGSGRKPKDKSKATAASYKPARKTEVKPESRLYSVPAHVSTIRTTEGCRFGG